MLNKSDFLYIKFYIYLYVLFIYYKQYDFSYIKMIPMQKVIL